MLAQPSGTNGAVLSEQRTVALPKPGDFPINQVTFPAHEFHPRSIDLRAMARFTASKHGRALGIEGKNYIHRDVLLPTVLCLLVFVARERFLSFWQAAERFSTCHDDF